MVEPSTNEYVIIIQPVLRGHIRDKDKVAL
jgi:hypothetical protein